MWLLYLIFLFSIIITCLSLPIFFLLLFRWWKKKSWGRGVLLIPASLLLIFSYFVYDAFYPADEFYKAEATKILGYPLPIGSNIGSKSASYPDQHGDYAACAAIKLSTSDFDKLLQKVTTDSSFSIIHDSKSIIGGGELTYVTQSFTEGDYLYRFVGNTSASSRKRDAYVLVGFLIDHHTIVIYRTSS